MINIIEELGIEIPTLEEFSENEKTIAVAKFSNHNGWNWYIIAGDKTQNDDLYCFGYVEGIESEFGYFTLNQILSAGAMFCPTFQRTVLSF